MCVCLSLQFLPVRTTNCCKIWIFVGIKFGLTKKKMTTILTETISKLSQKTIEFFSLNMAKNSSFSKIIWIFFRLGRKNSCKSGLFVNILLNFERHVKLRLSREINNSIKCVWGKNFVHLRKKIKVAQNNEFFAF